MVQSPGPHLTPDLVQGVLADRGHKRDEHGPVLGPRCAWPESEPEERKRCVLIVTAAFAVLAVHDPGFVGMQPQPDLAHPVLQRGQHLAGLTLADAVHDRIIDIAFEPDARELPSHPHVKRIVQEQVSQHWRNRRPLRGAPVLLLQGTVGQLHRGL